MGCAKASGGQKQGRFWVAEWYWKLRRQKTGRTEALGLFLDGKVVLEAEKAKNGTRSEMQGRENWFAII